jgi:outer membrane protein OmpA-like peptidoglycan-associated protein
MKSIGLLLAANILIFSSLSAQIKIGAGGGAHLSSVMEKNDLPGWNTQYKGYYTSVSGFHAGVFAELPVGLKDRLRLLSSLQYSSKGRNFARSYDSVKTFYSDTSSILASWKTNYVELPVTLAYRIPISKHVNLVAGLGGYAAYMINSKTSYDFYNASGEHTAFKNKMASGDDVNTYNKFDFGVQALAGLDFNDRVMFTLNYSRGLSDFYTATYGGSFKHEVLGATLVVWLTKSKTSRASEEAKDTDQDGVPDKLDQCNGQSGTAAANGCPDTDSDGIPDKEDKCPGISGFAKYGGCPAPDADKDGVADEQDKCPDIAGVAKYDGCPVPDSDNDGINDEEDACKDIAGTAKYKGCPVPDSDNDGVNDEEDKCPLKPGSKQNNGCPVIERNMIDEINKAAHNILFDVNSENIKITSYASLDKIAEILIKDKDMKLTIEGHTDNTGSVRINQVLSGKRALAIKIYLVNKGVAHDRMTALGFGSEHPIASNNTEAGRAKNRRVEFKVTY